MTGICRRRRRTPHITAIFTSRPCVLRLGVRELEFGGHTTAVNYAHACDAKITPVVWRGRSAVGRWRGSGCLTPRNAKPSAARDGGCAHPAATDPTLCQIHHIRHGCTAAEPISTTREALRAHHRIIHDPTGSTNTRRQPEFIPHDGSISANTPRNARTLVRRALIPRVRGTARYSMIQMDTSPGPAVGGLLVIAVALYVPFDVGHLVRWWCRSRSPCCSPRCWPRRRTGRRGGPGRWATGGCAHRRAPPAPDHRRDHRRDVPPDPALLLHASPSCCTAAEHLAVSCCAPAPRGPAPESTWRRDVAAGEPRHPGQLRARDATVAVVTPSHGVGARRARRAIGVAAGRAGGAGRDPVLLAVPLLAAPLRAVLNSWGPLPAPQRRPRTSTGRRARQQPEGSTLADPELATYAE